MELIKREAALEAIDHERKVLIEEKRFGTEHVVVHHARRLIEDLPAVDAIPVAWLRDKMNWADDNGEMNDVDCINWLIQTWQKEREESCFMDIRSQVISLLDIMKRDTPDQVIVMETPNGTVSLKIGDALVYEDPHGWIVIDAE